MASGEGEGVLKCDFCLFTCDIFPPMLMLVDIKEKSSAGSASTFFLAGTFL